MSGNPELVTVLASVSDSFAMLDSQWRFTYVNPKTAEMAGLTSPELLGRVIWDVFPDMVSTPFQKQLTRAAEERTFARFEYFFRRFNRWFESRVYPSPEGVTLLTADITDRKRAEEASLQLAAIVESSDDAIIGENLEGTITSWNAGASRLFGYEKEEVLGRPISILVPSDRPDEIPGIFRQLEEGRSIDHFETIRVRKDGRRVHVSLAISPIRDVNGTMVGSSKIARDITDRKRAEDFLRESERRLRLIAEAIPQLVWTWLPDGKVEYTNQRWFAYTGMSAEDIQGSGWTAAVHPDDRAGALEAWSRGLREGSEWSIEHRLRGTDGHYRWFLTRAVPLQGYDGGILHWFATCTDIEEQKRTQEVLQESDRRKNEFLAILAHELRNPLAPIRNAVHLLRLAGLPSPDLQNAAGLVDRQVQNLTRLVDDLLDVSRITRGKINLKKEPVELAVVVSRAVETSRPLIDACRHEFEVSLPSEPLYLQADLIRIAQVLSNLLNNAAKYTPQGGRILLSAQRDGEEVVFRVQDSGMGIPPAMLHSIFDAFVQVEDSLDRCHGGLGIGLTLVRGLVELHGGKVEARSAGPGKGSEFLVRLPLPEEVQLAAPVPRSVLSQEEGASRLIMVVDDNVDSAESLSMLLRLKGHEVHMATSGQEALEIAAKLHPEVVLLDIGLPGMNGYEVARRLKARPETEKSLLIALTGFGQEEDRRRAIAAGFDSHLTKPVELEVLYSMIDGAALV